MSSKSKKAEKEKAAKVADAEARVVAFEQHRWPNWSHRIFLSSHCRELGE